MILQTVKKNKILSLLLLFLIISLMGLSKSFGYQQIITFGLIPFMFFYLNHKNNYRFYFFKNPSVKAFIGIFLWSLLLIFNSFYLEAAFNNIIQLVGVLISGAVLIETVNYKKELVPWILLCFIIGFYISIYLMLSKLGAEASVSSKWIDRSQYDLNANKYSYFSFLANFSAYALIEITRKKTFIWISILTTLLGIYASFYTASRSGMGITALVAVIYWVFVYKPQTKRKYLFLKTVIVLTVLFTVFQKLYDVYEYSYLAQRVNEASLKEDGRAYIAKDAANVFIEHPFLGVGPAQFAFNASYHKGSYSHNSYLEAASNLGFLGLLLVLYLFGKPLFTSLKYRKSSTGKTLFLFFLVFLIYNNFYVFYWSAIEMMFFFFMTELLYQKQIKIV